MKHIELKNISKIFKNGYKAINNLSLDIYKEEFLVIVGPSGCGKTTLLKIIAGLESISSGELYINGLNMNHVKSNERNIAMVFQNYPLFDHMSVFENIMFGVKTKTDVQKANQDILSLSKQLSISELLHLYPSQLSGGQKQRVALARSLISKPEILLMDEPLSNLDISLKQQLRQLIKELHQTLHTTFIYVTHDQQEALSLASKIVVLKDGNIIQEGSPEEIYHDPNNIYTANFMSQYPINLIEYPLEGLDKLDLLNKENEQNILIGIRPEDFIVDESNPSSLCLNIQKIENIGSDYLIYTSYRNNTIVVRSQHKPNTDTIHVTINKENVMIFDKETEIKIN